MNRVYSRSVINSLKGRIWLSVSGLAVLNCVFGLGAFLGVSFFTIDPLITIFVTCLVLSMVTLVFGWWLSNDVMRPIESVTLLAKSLERSPSASLPRTTGSTETDELLQTLHRSGRQLQNLIALMDDVAAGKTEAALLPLESADKLSASFQKLVGKVTDSISARRDLDALQSSLSAISSQLTQVRNGKLTLNLRSEQPQTKEIADTLRFLANRLGDLAQHVVTRAMEGSRAAQEAREALQTAVDTFDEKAGVITNCGINSDVALRSDSLLNEFSKLTNAAIATYEDFASRQAGRTNGTRSAEALKAQISDTSRKIRKLRDRTASLSMLARSAQELTNRSNLVAINSSVVSKGTAVPLSVLTGEIEALSERAGKLTKSITSLNEGLNGEIADLEIELATLSNSVPDIALSVSASVDTNHELGLFLSQLTELEQKLRAATEAQNAESQKIASVLRSVSDFSRTTTLVRSSESSLQKVMSVVDSLRDSVVDLVPSSGPLSEPDYSPPMPAEAVNGYETLIDHPAADGAGEK